VTAGAISISMNRCRSPKKPLPCRAVVAGDPGARMSAAVSRLRACAVLLVIE
jgi:hypothetical protein